MYTRIRRGLSTGWNQLIVLLAAVAVLHGCTSAPPLVHQVEPEMLAESDALRQLRQEKAAVPLEQRIEMIEADLHRTLVEVGNGVLVPRSMTHDGRRGPLHIETNAAVLSALAVKYGVTGDEQAKALGERIITGLLAMDERTGELDGLVPFALHARTLEPADHATHANAYTQLLFAYVLANMHFGFNEDVQRHISLIYQSFVSDNFALRQMDGETLARATLRSPLMCFNARQVFDRRLLDTAALKLGDAETRALAQQQRYRGPRLGPMHVRLFALELPTTSSSWLNLQALTALNMLGESYQSEVRSLASRYRRENNPLFRTFAALAGADEDLDAIRDRLAEFPYPATTSGIINSHRDDVSLTVSTYTKFRAAPASRKPLPLYDIRSTTYLWKRSLREIDAMPEERPTVLLGHDLYQAYWLYRLAAMTVE